MKKIFLSIAITAFVAFGSAQNHKLNGWFTNVGLGFSQYEKENNFKVNSSSSFAFLGKEIQINSKNSILAGLKVETLNGNYSDFHFSSSFVSVPIIYRHYFSSENSSTVFFGFGIENRFKINENYEYIALGTKTKGENAYHLGGLAELGYRTQVVENLDFLIGLNYTGDFATLGYENEKSKNFNSINLFLGIDLYRKNEK